MPRLLQLTSGVSARRVYERSEFRPHVEVPGEVVADTWEMMEHLYGLSRSAIEDLETSVIRRLKSVVCTIVHPVLDRIVAVDVPNAYQESLARGSCYGMICLGRAGAWLSSWFRDATYPAWIGRWADSVDRFLVGVMRRFPVFHSFRLMTINPLSIFHDPSMERLIELLHLKSSKEYPSSMDAAFMEQVRLVNMTLWRRMFALAWRTPDLLLDSWVEHLVLFPKVVLLYPAFEEALKRVHWLIGLTIPILEFLLYWKLVGCPTTAPALIGLCIARAPAFIIQYIANMIPYRYAVILHSAFNCYSYLMGVKLRRVFRPRGWYPFADPGDATDVSNWMLANWTWWPF
jgi:hypothetical protein